MRITLNLATKPFADQGPALKRLRISMLVLAVIAIGLIFGLRAIHEKAEAARARDHSLDGQIAQITREHQGYEELMRQPPNAQLLDQVSVLNQLFDAKGFSWTLAMEDLETVLPRGVQVSTLEPVRAKDGHTTLHLRVIGPRDRAVELVRNLEHSRRFLLPRIVGENAETTGGPGDQLQPITASSRVNFDLLADYNPASPGERKTVKKPTTAADSSSTHHEPVSHGTGSAGQHVVRPPYTGSAPHKPPPPNQSTPGGPQ